MLPAERSEDEPIRIWVPGCATGEEAYSVAIAMMEVLGDQASARRIQIFATDVSENAIEHARTGVYPLSIAADVASDHDLLSLLEANLGIAIMPQSARGSSALRGVMIDGLALKRSVSLYAVAGRQRNA